MKVPQAVIFIGIQASGKSSFYKARFFNTHLRINLDMLRTRPREKRLFQACLAGKISFVIDNTNPIPEDRARYILLAKAAGFQVIGYFFYTSLESALQRNAQRTINEQIPEKGVRAAYRKLRPPTLAEGFDKLYRVMISPQKTFVVEELV
jgi:predicted kinase